MTLNREKLIETTAKAMLKYNSFTEDCAQLGTFEETWEATKWHWLKMAEDALKAIGGYLPDADFTDSSTLEACRLAVIYRQFKNICEGK